MKCPHCYTQLFYPNPIETGRRMRDLRISLNKPMKAQATDMGVSVSYVSLLESGKRAWDEWKITAYKRALVK